MTTSGVSPHVMAASIEDRLIYFNKMVIVPHRTATEAVTELEEKAFGPADDQPLVLLVGPTGVGKSCVQKMFVQRKRTTRKGSSDPSHAENAAVRVEVMSSEKGRFDFAEIYRGTLKEMKVPLYGSSLPSRSVTVNGTARDVLDMRFVGRNPTTSALRDRFDDAMRDYKVSALCLDEAINVFKVGAWKSERQHHFMLKEQGDVLKSMANRCGTPLILAGAYDFVQLTNASGQLARRSAFVHLKPYSQEAGDVQEYLNTVESLLAYLPVEHTLTSTEIGAELFLQSLGCIGIAKTLLARALRNALTRGCVLTADLMRDVYYKASALKTMRAEMQLGEELMRAMTSEEIYGDPRPSKASDAEKAAPPKSPVLTPGETKPSHRADASQHWTP